MPPAALEHFEQYRPARVAEEDHGFMYDWSFLDPDGHGWGVFWMDPAAAPGDDAPGDA